MEKIRGTTPEEIIEYLPENRETLAKELVMGMFQVKMKLQSKHGFMVTCFWRLYAKLS